MVHAAFGNTFARGEVTAQMPGLKSADASQDILKATDRRAALRFALPTPKTITTYGVAEE